MNYPKVVYIGKTAWSDDDFFDSPAYFNERFVRALLRDEYERVNYIVRHVFLAEEDIIDVDKCVELAISKLKVKFL